MKNIILLTMLAIPLSMPAFAADAGTEKNSAQVSQEEQNFDNRITQMQEQMTVMHAQMNQIRQTTDPQERQKLIQEHWNTMQKTRGLMDGMWGPGRRGGPGGPMMGGPGGPMMGGAGGPMMGGRGGPMMGGSGGPMMWNEYRRMSPEQMRRRQYMMDQYMGMQQQMMDQMMEHQGYMWKQ